MQLITYVIYSGLLTYNSLKYLGVNGVYALRLRLHRQTLDTTSYYIPVAIVCSMGKFLLESLVSNRSRADPLIFRSMCFQSCFLLPASWKLPRDPSQGCTATVAPPGCVVVGLALASCSLETYQKIRFQITHWIWSLKTKVYFLYRLLLFTTHQLKTP